MCAGAFAARRLDFARYHLFVFAGVSCCIVFIVIACAWRSVPQARVFAFSARGIFSHARTVEIGNRNWGSLPQVRAVRKLNGTCGLVSRALCQRGARRARWLIQNDGHTGD